MVVGPSGGGKSAMINAIQQRGVAITGASPNRVTEHMASHPFIIRYPNNVTIKLIDTRGFLDTRTSFMDMVNEWNANVEKYINVVDYVIFVFPMQRFPASLTKELRDMVRTLEEWGMKQHNVIVVLNKTDFYTEAKVNEFIATIRARDDIPAILLSREIIPTCFIQLDEEIRDEFKPVLLGLIGPSLDRILDELFLIREDSPPFYPRQVLLTKAQLAKAEEEREQHRQERSRLEEEERKLNAKAGWTCAIM